MAKVNYSTPDTAAWRNVADSLFLSRYRGRPCEICGASDSMYNNRRTRSSGHHLLSKRHHPAHRYNPDNILILCPSCHCQHSKTLSPHSENTYAVACFYNWLHTYRRKKYEFILAHGLDECDNQPTYKEIYVRLGGKISDDKFIKDQKPVGHAEAVRLAEGND